jgi:hypothetical protein
VAGAAAVWLRINETGTGLASGGQVRVAREDRGKVRTDGGAPDRAEHGAAGLTELVCHPPGRR